MGATHVALVLACCAVISCRPHVAARYRELFWSIVVLHVAWNSGMLGNAVWGHSPWKFWPAHGGGGLAGGTP